MNESSEYDYECNGAVIGDAGVGKTSLLLSFASYSYTDAHRSRTGINYTFMTRQQDVVKLNMRDGAEEVYLSFRRGIILAYDITNKESFKNIQQWYEKAETQNTNEISQYILVGCKADIAETGRQVQTAEAAAYAEKLGIPFFETSVKTGANIEKIFMALAEKMPLVKRLIDIRAQLVTDVWSPDSNEKRVTESYRAYEKELKAIPGSTAKGRALRRIDGALFFAIKKNRLENSLLISFAEQNIQRWREEAMALIKKLMKPSPWNQETLLLSDLQENFLILKEKLPVAQSSLHKELDVLLDAIASTSSTPQERHAPGLQAAASSSSSAPLDRKTYALPSFASHYPAPSFLSPGPSPSLPDTKQAAPQGWIETSVKADDLLEKYVDTPENRKALAALRDRLRSLKEENILSSAKAMMSFLIDKISRELSSHPQSSSQDPQSSSSSSSSSSRQDLSSAAPDSASSESSAADSSSFASVSASSFFPSASSTDAPVKKPEEKENLLLCPINERHLLCPISFEIMSDPVIPLLIDENGKITQAGDSFGRAALLEWCEKRKPPVCPLTQQRIYLQDGQPFLINNKVLKDVIKAYISNKQKKAEPAVPSSAPS